jgi:hypothetical protein
MRRGGHANEAAPHCEFGMAFFPAPMRYPLVKLA